MTDTLVPRDLVDFLLFDWLGLEDRLQRPQFDAPDARMVRALLDLADWMARETFQLCYILANQVNPRWMVREMYGHSARCAV